MPADRHKLPGVLLLSLSALGILVSALLAGGLVIWVLSAAHPAAFPAEETAGAAIISSALLVALLNIPTLLLSVRYLAGQPIPPARQEHRKTGMYLMMAWLVVLLAGGAAGQREQFRWLLIPLSLPAVFLPIGWLIVTARRGLPRPSLLREWGTLTVGLTVVPVLIIMLEFVLLGAAIAAVVIALGFNPGVLERLISLPVFLGDMPDQMEALEVFSREPVIMAAIFTLIGGAVPFVEELLKPLAIWLQAPRALKPAEGYSLGLISGGAFALLESSALVSQIAFDGWLSVVALRGIASMLHIGLSGWVGYSIASSLEQKRPGLLLGSLLGAITLHGIWNSMTLVSGLSASPWAGEASPSIAAISASLALSVMGAVLLAIFVINGRINLSLRRQSERQVDRPDSVVEQPTDRELG